MKTTFLQESKKFFLTAASFALAIVLLGGVNAAASETTVTTDQGTFTIGYGRKNSYSSYDGPTVIGYTGGESDVTLPTTVTINDEEQAVTILGEAFKSNKAITSVTVPEGYTAVDSSALEGCGLTRITLPASLTRVGPYAFGDCTNLTTVTFAENAEGSLRFMNKVFDGCTALKTINLPVQTESVYSDGNIFTGCTALESITLSAGNAKYLTEGGSLYAKNDEGTAVTLCTYVKAPAELTLPAAVNGLPLTAVGPMVFQKNTALTSVTLPASVTTVDRMAFDSCSNLASVLLQCETAPTLGNYAFTDMASGSTIYVPNETVAAAFASPDNYTNYYTASKTTVKVGVPTASTAASVSLKASEIQEAGKVSFDLYLDSAAELNAVMFQLRFDATQVTEGTVTVADSSFTNNNFQWTEADGTLTAVLQFGKTGDGNLNYTDPVKLSTITLSLKDGASGSITATLAKAVAAGAGEDAGPQVDAVITAATASVFIPSYDVNGDGKVDLKDIAEAQRYYQAASGDENWYAAKAADVNGDGVVDIQDFTALFHAVIAAMGWL